ncbi:MAG: 3-deoxy-D-manno-octulosonic acid transferase [Planctomycetes bacterium]|nr:3-deoxy-D-manno-octulosonic acid transferase [Planctomycetota bacterium]
MRASHPVFDLFYALSLLFTSPFWLLALAFSGRWRRHLGERLGGAPGRPGDRPCLWVHGSSVGEVLLAKGFVAAWRKSHPDWDVVVSAFTPTGREVAKKNFGDLPVFQWPLDLSFCVRRALRRVRPTAVALVELEVWPNFVRACRRRGVPVVVVNGRISARSAHRYAKLPMRGAFRSVTRFLAQTDEYAERARAAGFESDRVSVTGNMKLDGLPEAPTEDAKSALALKLGIDPKAPILVGGSTHDPEEQILLHAFEELRAERPELRLVLVPRHPERGADVAKAAAEAGFETIRKTEIDALKSPPADAVLVVDTVGELRTLWGLATVAYVGGSLTSRGGQNVMEPASMGKPVVFGPHMENFREAESLLKSADGCVQVPGNKELLPALRKLFADAAAALAMGERARKALQGKSGATARNIAAIEVVLSPSKNPAGQAASAQ